MAFAFIPFSFLPLFFLMFYLFIQNLLMRFSEEFNGVYGLDIQYIYPSIIRRCINKQSNGTELKGGIGVDFVEELGYSWALLHTCIYLSIYTMSILKKLIYHLILDICSIKHTIRKISFECA